jgi:aquaglyceroporin related protein
LGTFLLAATVCLIGQPENLALRLHTKAFILGAALIGVSSAVGVQTSFALNPARDLGPRIAASAFGYPSTIWTNRHGYWFWGPILGPIGGALLGVGAVEGMNKLNIAVDMDSRALL